MFKTKKRPTLKKQRCFERTKKSFKRTKEKSEQQKRAKTNRLQAGRIKGSERMKPTQKYLDIVKKTNAEKLDQLINDPDTFCEERIYVIDFHLGTELSNEMRAHLETKKKFIEENPDEYIAENMALIIASMPEPEEVIE